jgi:hypothetical protein
MSSELVCNESKIRRSLEAQSQQRKLVVKNVNACFVFPKMDVDEQWLRKNAKGK